MKPRFISADSPDFDPIARKQDRESFRAWAQSLRDDEEPLSVRLTDAVVCELAHYSLQRSFKRLVPLSWKWRVDLSDDRIRVVVVSPSGVETAFSDSCLGVVVYQLERADWQALALASPGTVLAVAAQPFRFADVDPSDPFERARAEIHAKRIAQGASPSDPLLKAAAEDFRAFDRSMGLKSLEAGK